MSIFNRLTQRFPAKVGGAAISALIVLHFVSQFIFFQNESIENENALPRIENKQVLESKIETEAIKPDAVPTTPNPPADIPPIVQPERRNAPLPKAVKKKQPRESKATRLRRAERLLTGV